MSEDKNKKNLNSINEILKSINTLNHLNTNSINYNNILTKYDQLNQIFKRENIINALTINTEIENIRNNISNKFNRSKKNELIKEIKNSFKNEKLVFVLGAGVSKDFGIPSWNTLLQELMVNTLESEKNDSDVITKLFSLIFNPNPLISGRYLQTYFESNKMNFENKVREILYEDFDFEMDTELMNEIVSFCIAPGKSSNLNSIITYNFDDLLEENLKKNNLDLPFRSIFGKEIEVPYDLLPIYHVHGYLPRKGDLTDSNKITLGENVYHEQYTDIYSWNNLVQINKFSENTCLFIGTSLTDPNIRRLLDISKKLRIDKNTGHYIFKVKFSKELIISEINKVFNQKTELFKKNKIVELPLDKIAEILIETRELFEENDLKSLGIKTIWIDDFDEIPRILKSIRQK
jgi:hypothetical protein